MTYFLISEVERCQILSRHYLPLFTAFPTKSFLCFSVSITVIVVTAPRHQTTSPSHFTVTKSVTTLDTLGCSATQNCGRCYGVAMRIAQRALQLRGTRGRTCLYARLAGRHQSRGCGRSRSASPSVKSLVPHPFPLQVQDCLHYGYITTVTKLETLLAAHLDGKWHFKDDAGPVSGIEVVGNPKSKSLRCSSCSC